MQDISLSKVGQTINQELSIAKNNLENIGPAVSIFGSARIKPDTLYYNQTVEVAKFLSEKGLAVISGGGPGLMEAANKGAQLGKRGKSVGLNIILPFESKGNSFQDVSLSFDRFAARKVCFCKYSQAFVCMPGGVGTLDELFEVVTLIQTEKMQHAPAVLYGKAFWGGLVSWLEDTVLAQGMISPEDLRTRIQIADSVEEMWEIISPFYDNAVN